MALWECVDRVRAPRSCPRIASPVRIHVVTESKRRKFTENDWGFERGRLFSSMTVDSRRRRVSGEGKR